MADPTVLLSGLGIPESPRWHEGRLWFCNWIDRQVVAAGMDGMAEVILARDPASHSMGYSIDWLPYGKLLTTGDKIQRQEPDGSMVTLAEQHANEIVVDGRGNAYINGADFDFVGGGAPKPGYIKLLTPGGELRQVAFDIESDGGLSGRRVFAEGLGPDGITMDAEGAVWAGSGGFGVARVAEGGEVLQRVELPESRAPVAVMLGGPDRRTLFILTAEWHPADGHVANLDRLTNGPRTGQILTLPVEVPGAGRP